jgi:hypothetical protein
MSKEALAKVVQRAISDGAFRRQLSSDPGTALRGFDLTADESAAIRSGDSSRLSTLGVDLRMSKAFSLASDQATGDAARPVLSNDLGASYTGATTVANQGSAGSSATTLAGQGSAGSSASSLAGQSSAGSSANTLTGQSSAGSSATSLAGQGSAGSSANTLGGQSSAGSSALTSGDQADHEAIISAGANAGRDEVVIPGEPAHALGSETSGDNSGTFGNVLTPGDTSHDGVLVIDDQGISGASTPGEASDGPTISQ